jgi:hypothetical protein
MLNHLGRVVEFAKGGFNRGKQMPRVPVGYGKRSSFVSIP